MEQLCNLIVTFGLSRWRQRARSLLQKRHNWHSILVFTLTKWIGDKSSTTFAHKRWEWPPWQTGYGWSQLCNAQLPPFSSSFHDLIAVNSITVLADVLNKILTNEVMKDRALLLQNGLLLWTSDAWQKMNHKGYSWFHNTALLISCFWLVRCFVYSSSSSDCTDFNTFL